MFCGAAGTKQEEQHGVEVNPEFPVDLFSLIEIDIIVFVGERHQTPVGRTVSTHDYSIAGSQKHPTP